MGKRSEFADAKKAVEEGGVERMNDAFNSLQTTSHKMAEALYQQTGSAPTEDTTEQASGAGAATGQGGGEDNVIDAEYVDVDENKYANCRLPIGRHPKSRETSGQ